MRLCDSRTPHRSQADPTAERTTDSGSSSTPLCVITNRPPPSTANGVSAAALLSAPGPDASLGVKGSRRWVRAAVSAGCPVRRARRSGCEAFPGLTCVCGNGPVACSWGCVRPWEARGGGLGCAKLDGARPVWGLACLLARLGQLRQALAPALRWAQDPGAPLVQRWPWGSCGGQESSRSDVCLPG